MSEVNLDYREKHRRLREENERLWTRVAQLAILSVLSGWTLLAILVGHLLR